MTSREAAKYERLLGCISNVQQLDKFVRAIESTEAQLRDDLDSFIDTRTHQQESKRLELARTELSTTLNNSSSLVDLLSNAGSLASKITARVRLLDAERSRVSETVDYVVQVRELRASILGAHSALEQKDWEAAAKAIAKIRTLPLDGEFINNVVPSTDVPDVPEVTVERWIEELTDLFMSEFNKAAESKDVETLSKFFALFPLIGKDSIGLDCYSKFICNIIASQSRQIITNQSSQDKVGFYPAALMKLLEIVSTMLNQHSHVISKYYGISHMTGIIERVERETDSQAGLISDTFYDQRRFHRVIDEIQGYKFPFLANMSTTPLSTRNAPSPRPSTEFTRMSEDGGVSVVEVGDFCSEISAFLHNWALYCKFIAVKWNEYQGIANQKPLKIPKPIAESAFAKKIQTKFLPVFETLSTFFIKRSLEQAFQLEEFPDLDTYIRSLKVIAPETTPVSSAMEDFVMVLSTSLKQSIETGQPVTVKNIINNIHKILHNDYLTTLHRRLRDLQPRAGSLLAVSATQVPTPQPQPKQTTMMGNMFMRNAANAATQAFNQISSGDEMRLHTFVILLNTVEVGATYLHRVVEQSVVLMERNYSFGSDGQKLEMIIKEMESSFIKVSNEIVDENVSILFNQVMQGKLRVLLTDCFKDVNYLISTFDEEENIVTRRFVEQWNGLVSPYIKTLDPLIYDKFLVTIVTTLSNLFERKLWSLENSINELGSIKLERDFSGLISEITRNKYSLRDKFLRVTQIILILGFDDEDDEIDMNWVLTPTERQKARSLRVDR